MITPAAGTAPSVFTISRAWSPLGEAFTPAVGSAPPSPKGISTIPTTSSDENVIS